MRKSTYILAYFVCFGLGAYVWRVKNNGVAIATELAPSTPSSASSETQTTDAFSSYTVIKVGQESISQDDIDWEFRQHLDSTSDRNALTPIPDLGERFNQEMAPLRRALIGTMIERKLLFTFLKRDQSFDYEQPARYSSCLSQWQQAVSNLEPAINRTDRERLKASLCERSIVSQYMKEKLFADVRIEEKELLEYYKNHLSEYKTPERVKIRHILVPNEAVGKTIRGQVNAGNFEALAKQYSIAPEGATGGNLGPFAKGSMPAVFEVAFHLKAGEISELLKSNYGYHLIQLQQHYPKQQKSFQEVKGQIAATLTRVRQEERFSKWVEQALAAVDVVSPKAVW